jgi:hypothetical protein
MYDCSHDRYSVDTRFAVIGCGRDGGLNFGLVVTKYFVEILDLNLGREHTVCVVMPYCWD